VDSNLQEASRETWKNTSITDFLIRITPEKTIQAQKELPGISTIISEASFSPSVLGVQILMATVR